MRRAGLAAIALLVAALLDGCHGAGRFDGRRAYEDVVAQVRLGPRLPGSEASREAIAYAAAALRDAGWKVEQQGFDYEGVHLVNLFARKGKGPLAIIGAHYDSRARADRDTVTPGAPVPGANDGASGVAVLLELGRTLDAAQMRHEVWLVLFDGEDQGGLNGWPWSVGARHFAAALSREPEFTIVVDMVGDEDQRFVWERSSTSSLNERIWLTAARLGYGASFVPEPGQEILDDHTPFLERGWPAVDIIDLDYPYWHKTADTEDKVSPLSLERVGRVLESLLEDRK